jgi:hypothetical protein
MIVVILPDLPHCNASGESVSMTSQREDKSARVARKTLLAVRPIWIDRTSIQANSSSRNSGRIGSGRSACASKRDLPR